MILDNITETCQFDKVKIAPQSKMGRTESCIKLQFESHAGIAVGYMHPNSVQCMGRHVLDVGKWVITRRFAEVERSMQYIR